METLRFTGTPALPELYGTLPDFLPNFYRNYTGTLRNFTGTPAAFPAPAPLLLLAPAAPVRRPAAARFVVRRVVASAVVATPRCRSCAGIILI
jgi:hypothetical protein